MLRISAQLDASNKALSEVRDILDNVDIYERDAAKYLGVQPKTMYHYRERGLEHIKVGRIISYKRKDLDAWRAAGKVHAAG
ncbi:helix-turn-helix domain-containing protein [Spirosoma sp. HMF4905]|uniref:Helix-turn-helix domain-containing protein n=2 Tax=Spirosoma arboris TaxID=2682092 RepID=A0A7K1SIT5_9BACT|nr:helix-turn-helix domain-containing protein [Spirosoma arboris]